MEIIFIEERRKSAIQRYAICVDCDRTSVIDQFGKCTYCGSFSVVVLNGIMRNVRQRDRIGRSNVSGLLQEI